MDQQQASAFGEAVNIPFPTVDVHNIVDPIPAIMGAPEFSETVRFFSTTPGADVALIPPVARAVIFTVIKNLRPSHIAEIGTWKGGMTEALALAIMGTEELANVHTASPYDAARFLPTYHHWPTEMRRPIRYYQVDSMTLFMRLDHRRVQPDVVVIDGNHDFEFALFDILAAARRLSRGGFLFINAVSQAGPYQAAMEFLRLHPEWRDCGVAPPVSPDGDMRALDRGRSRIDQADMIVLRAPFEHFVVARPESRGEIEWEHPVVNGIRLTLAGETRPGTLFIQCILRGFGDARITEVMRETKQVIEGQAGTIEVNFTPPLQTDSGMDRYFVEPWLAWRGEAPLKLAREIEVF